MTLIDIFTDYVVNKKSLKEYVVVRKTMNERGEFNDNSLIQAQKNLDRLTKENKATLNQMYDVLDEIIKLDSGHSVEYPIDFIKEILRIYKCGVTPQDALENYKEVLNHKYNDA